MSDFYYLQTSQFTSINTKIRKGKYTKRFNYKKISESVMTRSLYIEDVFKKLNDIELIEDRESDYVTYSVIQKKGSTNSKLGKIIIKGMRHKNRDGGSYSSVFYKYLDNDSIWLTRDYLPHPSQLNEQTLSHLRTFLIEHSKELN